MNNNNNNNNVQNINTKKKLKKISKATQMYTIKEKQRKLKTSQEIAVKIF